MVRYRRNFVPGGTFFFTVTLADRRSSVLVEHIPALRSAFRLARSERPFAIDAIVVLPDHLHVVMTLPQADADFSGRWRRIKSAFTRRVVATDTTIQRNAKGEYSLWQRRFWEHTIRDENDFARHVDYIHFNPVKHGHVTRVRDWSHSSFHRYVREGLLPQDWAGDLAQDAAGFGERAS
jgi:putative transposase